MKTKCIIFAIMAMAFSLIASAYVPLVREGVKWVYYWDYDNEPNDGVIYHCEYAMEISGDTIVNGVTYKKLYLHPLSEPIGLSEPYALVREENKVVYIYSDPNTFTGIYWEMICWYIDWNTLPLVAGQATNEWVLYDFNDVNRTFSNITAEIIEDNARYRKIPEYTYSETIELQGESAKVYVGDFPTPYLIEGLGYVGEMYMVEQLQGWVYSAADVCAPLPLGYPFYYYEFSYFADDEGNVLYKGPAYTKMCDNNYDRKVDGNDLNRLINFVLNGDKPWESYKYDANGDGEVDGADINEVINFILKK